MKSLHFFLGKKNQHGLRIQEIILKIYKIKILTCQTGAFLFSVSDTITSQKSFLLATQNCRLHMHAHAGGKHRKTLTGPGGKLSENRNSNVGACMHTFHCQPYVHAATLVKSTCGRMAGIEKYLE